MLIYLYISRLDLIFKFNMKYLTYHTTYFFLLILSSSQVFRNEELISYIIHVNPNHNSTSSLSTIRQIENYHKSFLPTDSQLIYSYHNAISGFSARLTEAEIKGIENKSGFLHAYKDEIVPLHTTHSAEFLGLDHYKGVWKDSKYGKGVTIGVLDTGIYSEHPSFCTHEAISQPKKKWRGSCVDKDGFVCNNKIIGARSYVKGINAMLELEDSIMPLKVTPYDTEGHGTHAASIAAGMFVENANMENKANGMAAGMAPYAHLSIYKVCSTRGCAISDVLAGMDRAIYDGVDVMSLSLGGSSSRPYYSDGIAIGAFNAMSKGIFISCAGGNYGPSLGMVSNGAPWVLTVGASSMDRSFGTGIQVENGYQFNGTITGSSVLAPIVASFSSRGPNQADPNIIKPDIIGPGVNILAASLHNIEYPRSKFNFMSGTSMAAAHLSGIAALLKSTHPTWSPAAIKSSIMTTAYNIANNNRLIPNHNLTPATIFDTGSGHADPNAASNPGLVYDLGPKDYIKYLCGLNYTDRQVSVVVGKAVKCSEYGSKLTASLNYPSFALFSNDEAIVTVERIVTNVGEASSIYKAMVLAPEGVSVTVEPNVLIFSRVEEKAKFRVHFERNASVRGRFSEGYLTWVSLYHRVNSPIVVSFREGGLESV